MQLKIDLHVHTDASHDGLSSLREAADAAKRRGLDGIAITDHDHQLPANEADRLSREVNLLILPGVEVTTTSGHLLVLLPHSEFLPKSPFHEVVSKAIAEGSVAIVPHPTDPFSHGVGASFVRSLPYRLPLEVINASTLQRYNGSAQKLATSLSVPGTGGSDAHMAIAVGDAFTVVEANSRSVDGVLDAIKSGRTSPAGGRTSLAVTVQGWLKKARRHNK